MIIRPSIIPLQKKKKMDRERVSAEKMRSFRAISHVTKVQLTLRQVSWFPRRILPCPWCLGDVRERWRSITQKERPFL